MEPMAIMRMAGHSDFKTTQLYIDLAGVVFSGEVSKLSQWYRASAADVVAGTKSRYQDGLSRPDPAPAVRLRLLPIRSS